MAARTRVAGAVLAAAVLLAGCRGDHAAASTAAVEHVAAVLADAGRAPAALRGVVGPDCGPTDEMLGHRVGDRMAVVDVAWADVREALPADAEVLPRRLVEPTVDAPIEPVASVDRARTHGDGWTVTWGESMQVSTAAGLTATTVRVTPGGEVDGATVRRWEQDGTVVDVFACG